MALDMTTPISDIVESLRAIKVAASERHTALVQEVQELEAAFPELKGEPVDAKAPRRRGRPFGFRGRALTAEERAAISQRMKAAWAVRKAANGTPAVQ